MFIGQMHTTFTIYWNLSSFWLYLFGVWGGLLDWHWHWTHTKKKEGCKRRNKSNHNNNNNNNGTTKYKIIYGVHVWYRWERYLRSFFWVDRMYWNSGLELSFVGFLFLFFFILLLGVLSIVGIICSTGFGLSSTLSKIKIQKVSERRNWNATQEKNCKKK